MGENILVTGGAGYIGTSLVNKLVRQGHNVTVFDNLTYGKNSLRRLNLMLENNLSLSSAILSKNLNSSIESPKKYNFIRGDIRDKEKVMNLITKGDFSYVFHLAEFVGHFPCEADPSKTKEVNYGGTQNVVAGVLKAKNSPRLIYNSSSSIYHVSKDGKPFTEESPLPDFNILDVYCKNKILCERHILRKAKGGKNFEFLIFRPATVSGLSARMRIDLLPNHFTYAATTIGRLSIANSRDHRAVISIRDLIDLYASLVNTPNWKSGIYNIGHLNQTKLDYTSKIRSLAGLNKGFIKDIQTLGDARDLTISSELLSKTYGFSPKDELKEIALPLIEVLRANPTIFSQESGDLLYIDQEFLNTSRQGFRELLL